MWNLTWLVICRNKDRGPQRHSVEVTTGAGGYRHIRPNEVNRPKPGMTLAAEGAITEESMTSSGNSELADSHHAQPEPSGSGGECRTTVNFLPPALNCMVRLWDQIAADMLQVRPLIYYKNIRQNNRKYSQYSGNVMSFFKCVNILLYFYILFTIY